MDKSKPVTINSAEPTPTLYLDWGHGGLNPNISLPNNPTAKETLNAYTTKGKSVDWSQNGKLPVYKGVERALHGGGAFCEGVENRRDGKILMELLNQQVQDGKLRVVTTAHEWQDTSLAERTAKANRDWAKKGRPRALFLSLHYNAAGQGAEGIILFTSPGVTQSDKVADIFANQLLKIMPKWQKGINNPNPCLRLNKDSPLERDEEEKFAVLVNTAMPSVLVENGFMTTQEEIMQAVYELDTYKMPMLKAYAKGIMDFIGLDG